MLPDAFQLEARSPSETLMSLEDAPPSVIKILNGALQALAERGANRLSMSDICHVSGVSRGTLYRYFKTKEDVLSAVSDYISRVFEDGVRAVACGIEDPIERLRIVMAFHDDYSAQQQSDKMVLIEPAFVLEFFRTHFARHKAALLDALGPVFDHFERRRDRPIDRTGVVEMMIRIQVSRLILPADDAFSARWHTAERVVEMILQGPERIKTRG